VPRCVYLIFECAFALSALLWPLCPISLATPDLSRFTWPSAVEFKCSRSSDPPPQNHQLFLVKHRAKFVAVFAASLARSCPVVFVPQNTHNKYTANRQRPESGSFANCNRSCKKLPMNNRPCVVNMNEWAHEKQPLLYDSTLKIA